jgi:hypothetical protein
MLSAWCSGKSGRETDKILEPERPESQFRAPFVQIRRRRILDNGNL